MKYGIPKKHLTAIQKVLRRFPNVKRGVLFGERAVEDYDKYSDVEIAVEGKVDWEEASFIKYYFEEETSLPYTFDIVEPERVKSERLASELKKEGVVIYEKKPRPGRPLKPARDYMLDKIMARRKREERSRAQARAR